MGLEQLSQLVENNNLPEIKSILLQAVANNNGELFLWDSSEAACINRAAREAILRGQKETVQFFMQYGVSASTRVEDGLNSDYLISFAASSGYLLIVLLLIENEEYQDVNDTCKRALNAAIIANHLPIVRYALQKGANANDCVNEKGMPYLAKAAQDGNTDLIKLLLKYGASIGNTLNIMGRRYQSRLSEESYASIVKTLLDYAFGIDFERDRFQHYLSVDVLHFLENIPDISGYNLMAKSLNGQPISHEMLAARNLPGAANALVSINDLKNLQDIPRQEALHHRLQNHFKKQGRLESTTGTINLVPLWLACEIGDEAAVKARLDAGINPNEDMNQSHRPIVLAAKNGHEIIVKLLAEHPEIDKQTIPLAIDEARINKHGIIANYLFAKQSVDAIDEEGNTLLHRAITHKDWQQIELLLSKGANVNLENNKEQTPLFLAASLPGELGTEIVSRLLQNNANPNQYRKESPLLGAVRNNNLKSVALLLPCTEKRAVAPLSFFPEAPEPWYVPLMFAALTSIDSTYPIHNMEILALLKTHGADFNTVSSRGLTLLNEAIKRFSYGTTSADHFEKTFNLITFLLNNGADVTLSDKRGLTLMHYLSNCSFDEEEYQKILAIFLKNGADINVKDKKGKTPLDYAIQANNRIAIELFTNLAEEEKMETTENDRDTWTHSNDSAAVFIQGAKRCSQELWAINFESLLNFNTVNINAKDKEGNTLLHHAIREGAPTAIKILVNHGTDMRVCDAAGFTPLALLDNMQRTQSLSAEKYLEMRQILLPSSINKNAMDELIRQRQRLHSRTAITQTTEEDCGTLDCKRRKPNFS